MLLLFDFSDVMFASMWKVFETPWVLSANVSLMVTLNFLKIPFSFVDWTCSHLKSALNSVLFERDKFLGAAPGTIGKIENN